MKRTLKLLVLICLLNLVLLLGANVWIVTSTRGQVYESATDIPAKDIALVLGTSRYLKNGQKNLFFYNRLYAAVELYKEGKIKHILVSGDNRSKYYNEPREMYEVLREMGVPKTAIALDFAGLRTLDSVVRSKEIFGQENVIIITQKFHAYRAAFIANHHGLQASCYVAANPPHYSIKKTRMREYLARVKALLDLFILKEGPRHLGDKEPIKL